MYDPRSPPWMKWLESTNQAASMLAHNAAEEAAAASSLIVHRTNMEGTEGTDDSLTAPEDKEGATRPMPPPPTDGEEGEQQVRLFHRAVVVANNQSGSMRGIVLQLGIDQFENEGRRVAAGVPMSGVPMTNTPTKFAVQDPQRGSVFNMPGNDTSIHRRVIQELLRPHEWCALSSPPAPHPHICGAQLCRMRFVPAARHVERWGAPAHMITGQVDHRTSLWDYGTRRRVADGHFCSMQTRQLPYCACSVLCFAYQVLKW